MFNCRVIYLLLTNVHILINLNCLLFKDFTADNDLHIMNSHDIIMTIFIYILSLFGWVINFICLRKCSSNAFSVLSYAFVFK